MIVAIDGPAGSGKSTVARSLAEELGFGYLDSGATYRAVALISLRSENPPAELADSLRIEVGKRVLVDGVDVTQAIRTPEVSARASEIAADPAVREALVAKQREMLKTGDWVAEGRDIGTVVAPNAELKVFLTASEEERARRRGADGGEAAASLAIRDRRDSERAHSPLRPAADAEIIDTTGLDIAAVVARIEAIFVKRSATGHTDRT
jgi:cytidylate kinase